MQAYMKVFCTLQYLQSCVLSSVSFQILTQTGLSRKRRKSPPHLQVPSGGVNAFREDSEKASPGGWNTEQNSAALSDSHLTLFASF